MSELRKNSNTDNHMKINIIRPSADEENSRTPKNSNLLSLNLMSGKRKKLKMQQKMENSY